MRYFPVAVRKAYAGFVPISTTRRSVCGDGGSELCDRERQRECEDNRATLMSRPLVPYVVLVDIRTCELGAFELPRRSPSPWAGLVRPQDGSAPSGVRLPNSSRDMSLPIDTPSPQRKQRATHPPGDRASDKGASFVLKACDFILNRRTECSRLQNLSWRTFCAFGLWRPVCTSSNKTDLSRAARQDNGSRRRWISIDSSVFSLEATKQASDDQVDPSMTWRAGSRRRGWRTQA